jgi:ATP-dependent Clp protease ATP-binding subunit ClpA
MRPEYIYQPDKTPSALEAYTRNVTPSAVIGVPLRTNEPEVSRILEILSREDRRKCHPMLIGEPDETRSAIVTEVIRRIAVGDVPDRVRARQVVALDIDALFAGTTGREELEYRFREIRWHIGVTAGRTLLFVEDFDRIADPSGKEDTKEDTIDMANILKPTLNRNIIRFFGTAILANYRRYIEKEASLQRHFQEVSIRTMPLLT